MSTPDQGAEQRGIGFAAALRARRQLAGLTQAELADRAGVGIRTVRDLERGRASRPQRSTIELLAAGLGLIGRDRAEFVALARGQLDLPEVEEAEPAGLPSAVGTVALPTPVELTGRDGDLAELADTLVGPDHLVTLVGLAGVGKSSLALAVIPRVAARFGGGVAGVTVSEVSTEADVLAAVASVFGVGRAEDLAHRFRRGPGLLMVDAVERSPGATAEALRWLALAAPNLHVLATGRHPIGLPGERVWPVTALEEPPADVPLELGTVTRYPAAELFVNRLRQVRREPLAAAETGALVALVRRLGGLPLALELAAAWGRVLDLNEILNRYGDRVLDLGGAAPGRAAAGEAGAVTLRDAVAASYQLLEPGERRALRRLSVFRNRWSVDLAEALLCDLPGAGSDPVPLLDRLVALGLVGVRGSGPYRFRLLDVVRDFALEQAAVSGELAAGRRQHARVIARLAARIAPDLLGPNLPAAVARFDDVASDLWAALAYSATEDPNTALALAVKLPRWWRFRGRDIPGRQWLRRLLDDPRTAGADPRVRAWAMVGAAQLAHEHGAGQQELPRAEQALAEFQRLGDLGGELAARSLLCGLLMAGGGFDEARRHNEAVLALATHTERVRDMAVAQINLTWHEIRVADLVAARRRLAAGDRLAAQCGDLRLRTLARANLAEVARLEGRYDEAVVRGRRVLEQLVEVGDPGHRRRVLGIIGLALAQAGRIDQAGQVLDELRELAGVQRALSGPAGPPCPAGAALAAWASGAAIDQVTGRPTVDGEPVAGRPAPEDGACAAIEATIALNRGDRELAAEWFAVAAQAYAGRHDLRDVTESLVGLVASTGDGTTRRHVRAWLDSVCQEGGITLLERERELLAGSLAGEPEPAERQLAEDSRVD